jgi:hypothetical protein
VASRKSAMRFRVSIHGRFSRRPTHGLSCGRKYCRVSIHPDLLARALRIEQNAQPNLTSVKGLGRSFAWSDYLQRRIELPLFDHGHG